VSECTALVAGKNLTFGEGDEERQAKAVERVSQGGSRSSRISRTQDSSRSSRVSRTQDRIGDVEGGEVGGAGGEGEGAGESGDQSKWGGTPVTAAAIACFPRFSRAAAGYNLTRLILSDNFLSESMMALLCTALRSMMTVTSLELERCGLGASGTPVGPATNCIFLRSFQFQCSMEVNVFHTRLVVSTALLSIAGTVLQITR